MGYDHVQLDFETGLASGNMEGFTSALNVIANIMHAQGFKISLTSYLSNYEQVYNTWSLASVLDYLNIQAYTNSFTAFQYTVNTVLKGMPEQYWNRLQVGMGDYANVNPPIAGSCVQFLLEKGIQSLAIWPQWGTGLSNGAYSFADDVYGCQNWNELCNLFLKS